jgi:ABC-type long-subunit fatty acid transport system fused permease/ATPase subunit
MKALREALSLAAPFWRSDERGKAWTLLGVVVALNLALVAMSVLLSFWNREFFNSLEARDAARFQALLFTWAETESGPMPGFAWIAALYITIAVYALYLRQALQIRWRRWITGNLLARWLEGRAYYRLSLEDAGADNPDQRLADDARLFVDDTLTLGLGLMRSVVTLASFLVVLWTLSGAVTVLGITIPGYMVWVAILYAVAGTWLAHRIGRPLVRLNFAQQKVEADFRYALVRFRDSAEGVALHRGEREERATLAERFEALMRNWWAVMVATKRLTFFTAGYAQVATVFPFVVAAPAFFTVRLPGGAGGGPGGLGARRGRGGHRRRGRHAAGRGRDPGPARRAGADPRCLVHHPGGRAGGDHRAIGLGQVHAVPRDRGDLALRRRHRPAAGRGLGAVPAAAPLSAAGHAAARPGLSHGRRGLHRRAARRRAPGCRAGASGGAP